MPALAESEIDSDDDSQPDNYEDDAIFESGGGDAANKDLWIDHRSPEPVEPSGEAPEEDDDNVGRGPDGRIGQKGTFIIARRGVAQVYFLAWQSLQESGG